MRPAEGPGPALIALNSRRPSSNEVDPPGDPGRRHRARRPEGPGSPPGPRGRAPGPGPVRSGPRSRYSPRGPGGDCATGRPAGLENPEIKREIKPHRTGSDTLQPATTCYKTPPARHARDRLQRAALRPPIGAFRRAGGPTSIGVQGRRGRGRCPESRGPLDGISDSPRPRARCGDPAAIAAGPRPRPPPPAGRPRPVRTWDGTRRPLPRPVVHRLIDENQWIVRDLSKTTCVSNHRRPGRIQSAKSSAKSSRPAGRRPGLSLSSRARAPRPGPPAPTPAP